MTRSFDAAAPPQIELRLHGDFINWLAASRGTLAVTTYNSGKLALLSALSGKLETRLLRLARPMGLAFDGTHLAIAVRKQIVVWRLSKNGALACAEACFAQAAAHETGRLNVHDVAFDRRGLCFAATRFNCAARPGERVGFRRMWRPAYIPPGVRQDCCHLNGLGVRAGRLELATAFCTSGQPGGWRSEDRFCSGVVVDVRQDCVVADGLCMPHSPRWDGRQWWLCNSGEGTLCSLDPHVGMCKPIAALPGFTRGLCFAGGRAVVGLSRIRRRHILDAPPVRSRFPRLRSGAWLVDPGTGRTTGAVEFVRGGREVYDVAFLPGIVEPEFTSDATNVRP